MVKCRSGRFTMPFTLLSARQGLGLAPDGRRRSSPHWNPLARGR